MAERIVAIGLLSERDLATLGSNFKRHFPIEDDRSFDELIAKIDMVTGEDWRASRQIETDDGDTSRVSAATVDKL